MAGRGAAPELGGSRRHAVNAWAEAAKSGTATSGGDGERADGMLRQMTLPAGTTPPPIIARSEVTALLEVRGLRVQFDTSYGTVRAIEGVDLRVDKGTTLGLVGESGSGKTALCLAIVRLLPKRSARIVAGEVRFQGEDLLSKSEREMRRFRGRRLSMIFQDPMTSLNPVLSIGNQLTEAIRLHQAVSRSLARQRALDMLRLVGIPSEKDRLRYYPHQLSGGMRQRVCAAIALACRPDLLIADEPTTALDATVQLQLLKLLRDIQTQRQMAMIFVSHDFGVIARMCDRVTVMYAARAVETGDVAQILTRPAHPYTRGLIRAVPEFGSKVDRLYTIEGQPPSLHHLVAGCPFAPRCPLVVDRCRVEYPPSVEIEEGHSAECWNLK